MKVVTMVIGEVNESKNEEFIEAFAKFKESPLPDGLIQSYLLKDDQNPDIHIIYGVWRDPGAFLEVRSSNETPRGIKIFQNVGVEPKTKIYHVLDAHYGDSFREKP